MRFFADETDLLLAKRLEAEFPGDVVYPGHRALPEIPRQSLDESWLPTVGKKRLVVITRDKRIRYKPVERKLWIDHCIRGFVLTGRSNQNTETSVQILKAHWKAIEQVIQQNPDGPWMYAVTNSALTKIDLAPDTK